MAGLDNIWRQHCIRISGRLFSNTQLPNDDPRLLEILLKYLTSVADTRTNSWQATIIDAGDGSGDGILELPDELLTQAGWKEGDQLAIDRTDSGELILRRAQ